MSNPRRIRRTEDKADVKIPPYAKKRIGKPAVAPFTQSKDPKRKYGSAVRGTKTKGEWM